MPALRVVKVLFGICHVQQTFHNVRHNYKWILLALLVSPPSSSPGASESCSLSSAFLSHLTWAWSTVWFLLETWVVNGLEAQVHTLPGTGIWGKKSPQTQQQGRGENDSQRSRSLYCHLNPSLILICFLQEGDVRVTYGNVCISFGIRNKE